MSTTITQVKTQTTKLPVNLNDIDAGDVFSEESHYVFLKLNGKAYEFKHLESGKVIQLDGHYVSELLTTADQFGPDIIEIGVDDKFWTAKQIEDLKKKGEDIGELREGDLKLKGIRSIWSDIHTTKVFSVCFDKKGKALTKKALKEAKEKQISDALAKISAGDVTMQDAFKFVQENPINEIEKGEQRVLRGYKVQFASINGFYDVIDMDIEDPEGKGKNIRKVNINEIKWLVIDGVKYVVE